MELEHGQHDLTDEMEETLTEYFQLCDVDKSNTISTREIRTAAQLLGLNPTNDELNTLLSDEDVDGDGVLNFSEFKALVMRFRSYLKRNSDELEEAINFFMSQCRSSDDNLIDKDEFRDFLKTKGDEKLTDEEIDDIFNQLDKNMDNKLDKSELVRLLAPLNTTPGGQA